ncbi:hypothetical protein [Adhaeribacter terreus]|uniref:STAS/SEC14 domain-containing protein n=1 Tax=Adhaeribacter terreus TaxID=529703 RepID=A0ABW0EHG0_9BACT
METLLNPATLFTYKVRGEVILASWHNDLRAESVEFFDSIKHLIQFATEHNLKKIFIDSGKPAGGILTEDVMLLVQKSIVKIEVDKIALLESSDFHWDNNLFQFLQYLKSYLQLYFEVRLFNSKDAALQWLGAI